MFMHILLFHWPVIKGVLWPSLHHCEMADYIVMYGLSLFRGFLFLSKRQYLCHIPITLPHSITGNSPNLRRFPITTATSGGIFTQAQRAASCTQFTLSWV